MQASKTKKTMSRKLLAMILGVAMVFTMMPLTGAYAEDVSAPRSIQIKGNVLKNEITITKESLGSMVTTDPVEFMAINNKGKESKITVKEGVLFENIINSLELKQGATITGFTVNTTKIDEGSSISQATEYEYDWLMGEPDADNYSTNPGFKNGKAMLAFKWEALNNEEIEGTRIMVGAFSDMSKANNSGQENPPIANYPLCIDTIDSIEVIGVAPIDNTKVVLDKTSFTFNDKVQKPVIKTIDGMALKEGTDYTAAWPSSKNVGSYKVKITGKDKYSGTTEATYKIVKAANPLKVSGKTAKIKKAKVKKKAQKLTATKVIKFKKKGQGKVTYAKASGNKKIKIAKTTGKVTVKKGLKKGTYKVKVKVKAAGNKNYKAVTRTVTFKIKVK